MAVCSVKEKKELFKAIKHTSNLNKAQEIENCTSEFQVKVEKAIEANNLCYNCETGFHYMKQ